MKRTTRQREAIREVFHEQSRPLGPEEVLRFARRKVPRIGLATVYRNLKSLAETGWLVSVDLPGKSALYEMAGKKHHHYFHCRGCDRCYEVYACSEDVRNLVPRGYVLEGHELILYGVCPACAKQKGK